MRGIHTGTVAACRTKWYALGAVLLLPAFCLATEVHVVGVNAGESVDVVIDGDAPVTLDVGETVQGVKVLQVDSDSAVLRIDGVEETLPLVPQPVSLGETTGGSSVTLSADAGGHFVTSGAVNGRSIRFLVDTGATMVTLSRTEARRLGIDYKSGTPTVTMTVNGAVEGWRVTLDSVSVGGLTEDDVEAVVVDNETLPVGLLGMSFLDRFSMRRDGEKLVLRQRR